MKICDIASSSNSPLNFKKLKLTYILRSVDILRSGYILSPWENTSVGQVNRYIYIINNKAIRAHIYMLAIAGHTARPRWLKFFEGIPTSIQSVFQAKKTIFFKTFYKFDFKKFQGQRRALELVFIKKLFYSF